MKKFFVIDMTDRFQFVAKSAASMEVHATDLVRPFYRENDFCEFVSHDIEYHENHGFLWVEVVVNRVCAVVADDINQALKIVKPLMKKSTRIVGIAEEE